MKTYFMGIEIDISNPQNMPDQLKYDIITCQYTLLADVTINRAEETTGSPPGTEKEAIKATMSDRRWQKK